MSLFDPTVPFRATFDGAEYQRALVDRVVDGDTVRVVLDLGHEITLGVGSPKTSVESLSPEWRED